MKKLGTILEEAGVIDEIQLVRALSHKRKWRCRLGKSLIELGFVTEDVIAKSVSQQLGIPYREFDPGQTPAELRQSKEIGAALMLAWLDLFQKAKP